MDNNESQAQTPWYLDKAVWMTIFTAILTILGPVITAKFGVTLDASSLAMVTVTVVTFIVMHKWKSHGIVTSEINAKNALEIAKLSTKVGNDTADAKKLADAMLNMVPKPPDPVPVPEPVKIP